MIQGKAEKLYLGNITTMDDIKPFAKAMTVVGDRIQYVGSVENAKALCDEKTEVFDFGDKYIYPGFLDSHTHGMLCGYRGIGQADVSKVNPSNEEKYREIIKAFVDAHPEMDMYIAAGWLEDGYSDITKDFLDEICPDKPLMLNSAGGHSLLLNSAAVKKYGITAEYAQKEGTDLVRVDEKGEPTGYLCEGPCVKVVTSKQISVEEAKDFILYWQDFAFSNGFTGVCDAGAEVVAPNAFPAYVELDKENKLKLYTYAHLIVKDNVDDPKKAAAEIAEKAEKYNSQHFTVIGSKVFLDGVLEAHTAWLTQPYDDQPGYLGNQRFNDPEKMTELIAENAKYGLSVHAHSDGDGATKFFLSCIEAAQKQTGNMDQRNCAAHLQFVLPEDIKRMADTNTVALVPPLWTPGLPGVYEGEIKNVGAKRAAAQYPIKSFVDAGADVVFHSDYPISPSISAPVSVYMAAKRGLPDPDSADGEAKEGTVRGADEVLTREQALLALTKNVAYMFHQEDNMGSLATGKLANMAILDTDLLNDNYKKLLTAKIVATVVDGNIVYKA